MNGQNTELAGRIEGALGDTPSPELILASLAVVARSPWERYCSDEEARHMARSIATSKMTELQLSRCGLEMPKWHGDVGGIARLASLLDAGAGGASDAQACRALESSRDALLDALLAPLLTASTRLRAPSREFRVQPARPQRKRAPLIDCAYMTEQCFKNKLSSSDARALYYIFCRATGKKILDAVASSSGFDRGVSADDLERYVMRASAESDQTLNQAIKALCQDYIGRVRLASAASNENGTVVFMEEPEDWRDTHDASWSQEGELKDCLMRQSLILFFEPVALAGCGARAQAEGSEHPGLHQNPTLAARLASAA